MNLKRAPFARDPLGLGAILVLGLTVLAGPTFGQQGQSGNQRPLSAWLQGQGDQSIWSEYAYGVGVTGIPDTLAWAPGDDPPLQPLRFAMWDYAGKIAEYLYNQSGHAINLGTTVTGTVTEQPLSDGRARVRVNIHTTNALVYCSDWSNWVVGPTVFGATAAEVLYQNKPPTLGEIFIDYTFINSAPGAPLPSLVASIGNYEPWIPTVLHIKVRASAIGPLHAFPGVPGAVPGVVEGTPGRLFTSQTGNFTTPPMGPLPDTFPVETVFLRPYGN